MDNIFNRLGLLPPSATPFVIPLVTEGTHQELDQKEEGHDPRIIQLFELMNHYYHLQGMTETSLKERVSALDYLKIEKKLRDEDAGQIPILQNCISRIKENKKLRLQSVKLRAIEESQREDLRILHDYGLISRSKYFELLGKIGLPEVVDLIKKYDNPHEFLRQYIHAYLEPFFKGMVLPDAQRPALITHLFPKFMEQFAASTIKQDRLEEYALDVYLEVVSFHYNKVDGEIKINAIWDEWHGRKNTSHEAKNAFGNLSKNFANNLFQTLEIDFKGCELDRIQIFKKIEELILG